MNKKPEKAVGLSSDHKEALASLAARPEFRALEKLLSIEQSNIVVQAFKIPSSDTELRTKKAFLEGRVYELVKIKKTFEESKKRKEE